MMAFSMSFLHSFLAVTGQTDAWSAEISAGAVFARQHRQRIDQQHQNHQNDSDGKGDVGFTALARVNVQRNGQGGGGGLQRGKEVVDHHAEAGGEQQCGGFAHDAANREDAAGHDAVDRTGQHHGAHHPPFAGAKRERAFAIALRHRLQAFLGGAHDGRQREDDHRQAAGENTGLQRKQLYKEQHAHQAENNRGNTGEGFGGEFDDRNHPAVFRVFGQINGGAHPDGQHDHHRQQDQIQRVEEVRQDADGVVAIARRGGQQVEREMPARRGRRYSRSGTAAARR